MEKVIIALMVLVVILILSYMIAEWFYEVAEEKGYHDTKYLWICFWLGIIGYLLVVALPDRGNMQKAEIDSDELPEL